MRFYGRQRSLRDAVNVAASCALPSGKRHPHQRRIPPETIAEARRRLLAADIREHANFDALHNEIARLIGDIFMVGELVIYDIAHRIGAHLRLAPESVYLHCGTRWGALALGLGRGRATLEMSELPREFDLLSPAEAEDCLCIYKKQLAKATASPSAPRR